MNAIERYRPFPVEALPEPLRSFVAVGAKAIGCDSAYIALPLLTAAGAAIGTTRVLRLKRGWDAPPIIWTAIVGESGTSKTPAFQLAMRALRERQGRALKAHTEALREYEADVAYYDRAHNEWKRSNSKDEPPAKPEAPQAERCIVSDTTVEALAPLLLANPRGLLLARDELAGWLGSFDRYAGKSGADAAHWLSMYGGEAITVDRKTGHPRTIHVPRAAVWVTGGIQPGVLHRALGVEHRESGLAARLLLACPPRKAKRWTEADIPPEAEETIERLFERLYELTQDVDPKSPAGAPEYRPRAVGMTPEAKRAWIAQHGRHAAEQVDLSGDLAAAWSKLEEIPARLALILHFVRWAADDPALVDADTVDETSIASAVTLTEWFKSETRRVYAMLGESSERRGLRELMDAIERRGGSVTPRDLMRSSRRYQTAEAAEAALNALIKAGVGRWEYDDSGGGRGRPANRFTLIDNADVDRNPQSTVKAAIVSTVNGVNGSVSQFDSDDMGEV